MCRRSGAHAVEVDALVSPFFARWTIIVPGAAERAHERLDHGHRERGRDRGVDGVAAAREDAAPISAPMGMLRGHHPARRERRGLLTTAGSNHGSLISARQYWVISEPRDPVKRSASRRVAQASVTLPLDSGQYRPASFSMSAWLSSATGPPTRMSTCSLDWPTTTRLSNRNDETCRSSRPPDAGRGTADASARSGPPSDGARRKSDPAVVLHHGATSQLPGVGPWLVRRSTRRREVMHPASRMVGGEQRDGRLHAQSSRLRGSNQRGLQHHAPVHHAGRLREQPGRLGGTSSLSESWRKTSMSRRIARIRSPSWPPNSAPRSRPVVVAGGPAEHRRHESRVHADRHAEVPRALRLAIDSATAPIWSSDAAASAACAGTPRATRARRSATPR